MNAARRESLPQTMRQALVVSGHEGHARMDRQCLKIAKVQVARHVSSGAEAWRCLVRQGADVVLIDDELADMSGWDFLRELRADGRFAAAPVIMVSKKNNSAGVLEAIGLGCAGFMLRPYSLDTFFKHLAMARHCRGLLAEQTKSLDQGRELAEAGRLDEAAAQYERASQTSDEAQHHFERGLRHLSVREYDQAIEAFTKASRICAVMTEAYLGLARCWQAKNDEVRYRKALAKAADICAKAERIEQYKQDFMDIIKADPRRFNPFLNMGQRLMSARDYDGAAMALKNAAWLTPDNALVHLEMAKVYHFRRLPEMAKRAASQALMLNEHGAEARALYERLVAPAAPDEALVKQQAEGRGPGFPALIPSMLYGVLYLAGMVTEGLHRFRRRCA
jgi:DNA-binding NarL/FixJ family response regulator